MPDFLNFIWLTAAGIGLFVFTEWVFGSLKKQYEQTRKLAHAGFGLLALFLPLCFNNPWWVLLLCGLFQLILVVSNQYLLLRSVLSVRRRFYGCLVYPIVVYLVYLIWFYSESRQDQVVQSYAYFYLPILILALCEPIASTAGSKYPILKFQGLNKNLGRTLTFWAIAFLLCCIVLLSSHIFKSKDITWVAIFISSLVALIDYYSKKGLDNLFLPVAVLLALYVVEYFF